MLLLCCVVVVLCGCCVAVVLWLCCVVLLLVLCGVATGADVSIGKEIGAMVAINEGEGGGPRGEENEYGTKHGGGEEGCSDVEVLVV